MKSFRTKKISSRLRGLPKGRTVLLVTAAALLALYFSLSAIATYVVRNKIERMGSYRGEVKKISLDLLRGAYAIEDLKLEKMSGEAPLPLFSAKRIAFNVAWGALVRGKINADIELESPSVNLIKARDMDVKQTGVEADWRKEIEELLPIQISSVFIHNGSVRFKDLEADPQIDVYLRDIQASAANLTNVDDRSGMLKSTIEANGRVMDRGSFQLHLGIEPLAKTPTFEARQFLIVYLPELNDFLEHYLAVEAKEGTLSYYLEGAAAEGKFSGYVKPFMGNVGMNELDTEAEGPLEHLKGAFVQISTKLFKNKERDNLATKVELTGSFDDPNIDVFGALLNFLQNAFIKAIIPQFEGSAEVSPQGKLVGEDGKPE